jgi:glucan phosphoethanolaminetransferase (alkaline phosphatase superfamily)
VTGGVVDRGWFTVLRLLLHLQVGLFGGAVLTTLLYLPGKLRLPSFLRIALLASFFIWLIWIILWVLVRRAFGIELSTDIVWELFTNRNAVAAVGLGDMEFIVSVAVLLGLAGVLSAGGDLIARRSAQKLLGLGCLVFVGAFVLLHLPLRLHALQKSRSNERAIVAYHDYVPSLLRVEQSSADREAARPALPSLESKDRTNAYLNLQRTRPTSRIPHPRNIIWINLESFRFDAIEQSAMPRLSASASRFQIRLDRQHWSGGNATQFGIFSQLTGLSGYHLHTLSRANMPSPFLALLARNGYRLRVAKKNQLRYIDLSVLLPPDTVQQDIATGARDVEDGRMVDAYLQDRATRNSAAPSFDFIAFDATHWPYSFPAEHALFKPAPPVTGSQAILGFREELSILRNRYRNSLHFADEQIARIFADLEARKDFDSSIIVILGDHGEEFQERGQMTHAAVLNDFQARTPLWIHLPEIEASALPRDVPTTHMDVVPTILQSLGFREDVLYTQGQSLLSNNGPRPALALSDHGFRVPLYRALVTDRYISRWSLKPSHYVFAGVQRRDGAPMQGQEWLEEATRLNAGAAEMYELLPDVSQTPRPFTTK